MEELLRTSEVEIRYGSLPVVQGVSIRVNSGQCVSVLGSNGSGKSSLLRGIMGAQRVSKGEIFWKKREIQGLRTEAIVKLGLVYVPEQKMLFGPLSVLENLMLGAYLIKDQELIRANLKHVFELFPRLEERIYQRASTLSGGEQQMLAIGRGLMSNPKLLMLDEPSLGLSPLLVKELLGTVARLKQEGIPILLVEQNVKEALHIADYGYVLQAGRLVLEGPSSELLASDLIRSAYLGL